MRNVKDCSEEVSSKSALKQIVDKECAGMERYLKSVQGQEVVKLLFRLRTDSAGLRIRRHVK